MFLPFLNDDAAFEIASGFIFKVDFKWAIKTINLDPRTQQAKDALTTLIVMIDKSVTLPREESCSGWSVDSVQKLDHSTCY